MPISGLVSISGEVEWGVLLQEVHAVFQLLEG
jgi:hypothetical protein